MALSDLSAAAHDDGRALRRMSAPGRPDWRARGARKLLTPPHMALARQETGGDDHSNKSLVRTLERASKSCARIFFERRAENDATPWRERSVHARTRRRSRAARAPAPRRLVPLLASQFACVPCRGD